MKELLVQTVAMKKGASRLSCNAALFAVNKCLDSKEGLLLSRGNKSLHTPLCAQLQLSEVAAVHFDFIMQRQLILFLRKDFEKFTQTVDLGH